MKLATPVSPDICNKKLRLLLKDCAQGFYQQMYFLGKDVTNKRGNQLLEYGFLKSPSKGLKGTSCYSLESSDQIIELYGSCACLYKDDVQIAFLRLKSRFYHWLPECRCVAGLWSDNDIDAGTPESIYKAITPLLQWWLEHESWISERFDPRYREACYKEWKRVNSRKSWLPPEEALHWVEDFLTNGADHTRPKKLPESRFQ